ncbi:hypothetical protein GCM10020254_07960 [Streptomyces goshikiensis]
MLKILLFVLLGALAALAVHDLVQRRHSLLRNYPLLGHLRFALEALRPEIQQYFIERNFDGRPFDRDTRNIVYQRAKGTDAEEPFGTELDLYRAGSEYLTPSMAPRPVRTDPPRVRIGGPDCTRPYDMALLNVSAMSFGSLSGNAVLALNTGARLGGFAHDTGEGGLSEYHLGPGGGPHLGDRHRLLRLPHRRRRLRRPPVRREGGARAGQMHLAEDQSGRQARHRGSAAGRQGERGDRGGPRCPTGADRALAALPPRLLHAPRTGPLPGPDARAGRRKARRFQAVRRLPPRVPRRVQGHAGGEHHPPTSSSSTARRAVRGRRRWSSRTTSACRSAKG